MHTLKPLCLFRSQTLKARISRNNYMYFKSLRPVFYCSVVRIRVFFRFKSDVWNVPNVYFVERSFKDTDADTTTYTDHDLRNYGIPT